MDAHADPTVAHIAAQALAAGFLIVMMFALGLEVGGQPAKDAHAKRHERRLLVRALIMNLVLIPLVAFALVHGLHRSGTAATAILLAAATPGGRYAPRLARMARAELGLAVEITLFLAKLTGFTAPVTIKWLLGTPRIEMHDLILIVQLLLVQMLPYLAGRWLRRKQPRQASKLARPLGLAELTLAVAFVVLLIARGRLHTIADISALDWSAGALFAIVSIAIGWTLGGPAPETRRAFAITAAARNLALALMIAGEKFPGGGVQLALIGICLMGVVCDALYAVLVRGRAPAPRLA